MNRKKSRWFIGILISVAVFSLIFVLGVKLIGTIDHASGNAETEQVENAVRSATLTCYAVEGAYPPSLDYLKDHYGLVYDDSVYAVSYDAFAENVFPDIAVMKKGAGLE